MQRRVGSALSALESGARVSRLTASEALRHVDRWDVVECVFRPRAGSQAAGIVSTSDLRNGLSTSAASRAGPLEADPMTSWLKRIVTRLRVWIGWGDLSSERLTPGHGWLLPTRETYGNQALAEAIQPAHATSRR
jgi:hypothetical protein